jgi:hypothetical protein
VSKPDGGLTDAETAASRCRDVAKYRVATLLYPVLDMVFFVFRTALVLLVPFGWVPFFSYAVF